MKKIILIAFIVCVMVSCTSVGVGVGVPLGPVNLGVGTTIRVPK